MNWTAPQVSIDQMAVIGLGSCQEFHGCAFIRSSWSVVVDVNCMSHGQRPESFVMLFRPAKGCMEHCNSCLFGCHFNGIFGGTILMMSSHTTQSQSLSILMKLLCQFFCCVNSIVRIATFDCHSHFGALSLSKVFRGVTISLAVKLT